MRVLTTRFVLGALVLGSLCLLAETAEGGPFRRRARMAAADPCCPNSGGYAMSYSGGYSGYATTPSYTGGYTGGMAYAPSPCWPAVGGGLLSRRRRARWRLPRSDARHRRHVGA
jgi:hypothetical protein